MPLRNTKEAIASKRDSLNHIPTHIIIRLDSKSILKLGPLDSSNLRFSSLNIPAHMNHSKSWLREGISCPAFSFSLSDSSVEIWAGTHQALIWTQRERGRRARLNIGPRFWECSKREGERDMKTWGDAWMLKQGFSVLSFTLP